MLDDDKAVANPPCAAMAAACAASNLDAESLAATAEKSKALL
jgi:hypothetical protein